MFFEKFAIKYLYSLIHLAVATPTEGALNQLWAAVSPVSEARKLSGHLILAYQTIGMARPDLSDPAKVDEAWQWAEEQVKKWS